MAQAPAPAFPPLPPSAPLWLVRLLERHHRGNEYSITLTRWADQLQDLIDAPETSVEVKAQAAHNLYQS